MNIADMEKSFELVCKTVRFHFAKAPPNEHPGRLPQKMALSKSKHTLQKHTLGLYLSLSHTYTHSKHSPENSTSLLKWVNVVAASNFQLSHFYFSHSAPYFWHNLVSTFFFRGNKISLIHSPILSQYLHDVYKDFFVRCFIFRSKTSLNWLPRHIFNENRVVLRVKMEVKGGVDRRKYCISKIKKIDREYVLACVWVEKGAHH